MKKFLLILATFFFSCTVLKAQVEKDSIQSMIVRFFDGISELNEEKLRSTSTSDFLLLEDGEIWNMDTLVKNVMWAKSVKKFERINKFEFVRTDQGGNTAWVSYFNTADIKVNDKQRIVKWLESAVLVKEKGRWWIKMLHSTVMK